MFLMKIPLALWRVLVLALGAATISAGVLTLVFFGIHTQANDFGSLGIDEIGTVNGALVCHQVAVKIDPKGSFAAVGGRQGDRLCTQRPADLVRDHLAGEHVPLTALRDGGAVHLELVLQQAPQDQNHVVYALGQPITNIIFCLVGMLIGLRAAGRADLRALALGLLLWSLIEPSCVPQQAFVVFYGVFALSALSPAFLFDFAIHFPDSHPGRLRARVAKLVPWSYAVGAMMIFVNGAIRLGQLGTMFSLTEMLYTLLSAVLIGATLLAGRAETRGEVRARFAWMLPAFFSVGINVYFSIGAIFPSLYVWWVVAAIYVLGLVFPVGLAYATLKHRVFDFGLAMNRALVYTIISSLLLVLFGVTEFAVDKLLHFHGRQTNVVIDAAVALGVILTFHRIQHWVSHRVDHTFYHHWHEAAQRLKVFVEKAVHISSPSVLQLRFIEAVDQFGGAAGSAIYRCDADGNYKCEQSSLAAVPAQLDADDELLVALRYQGGVLELADAGLSLPAALALPMTVRGQVDGLLLVGHKNSGAAYRPDEIELLAAAAHRVALDLESLRVARLDRENAELTAAMERLRQVNAVATLAKEKAELALSLQIASA